MKIDKRASLRAKQQENIYQKDSDDIDVERIETIVNPIIECTYNLKTEFCIQIIKLYYCPENDGWDYKYNAINNAKKFIKAE